MRFDATFRAIRSRFPALFSVQAPGTTQFGVALHAPFLRFPASVFVQARDTAAARRTPFLAEAVVLAPHKPVRHCSRSPVP